MASTVADIYIYIYIYIYMWHVEIINSAQITRLLSKVSLVLVDFVTIAVPPLDICLHIEDLHTARAEDLKLQVLSI